MKVKSFWPIFVLVVLGLGAGLFGMIALLDYWLDYGYSSMVTIAPIVVGVVVVSALCIAWIMTDYWSFFGGEGEGEE